MDKYKWDLRKIFKNEKEFFDAINKIKENVKNIIKYKGKIKENLYSLLELQSQTDLLIDKVYVYAYLSYYSDTANNKFQEYKNVAGDIYDFYARSTSFINPEIQLIDSKKIEKLISDDKRLSKYEFLLSDLFRYKKHILSEKEEILLKSMSSIFRVPNEAFVALDNTDIELSSIKDENNKDAKLTSSNYSRYITSSDERVRKDAFESMTNFYKKHINTIKELYAGSVKKDCLTSKIRNYNSALEAGLFGDNIPVSLYETLIKVTDKNISSLQEYYNILLTHFANN